MSSIFFFNDTTPTEIYTLPLHAALPISVVKRDVLERAQVEFRVQLAVDAREHVAVDRGGHARRVVVRRLEHGRDRKSTRLNSSHANISYAVFCLKKKK